jgi:hypothetical protein
MDDAKKQLVDKLKSANNILVTVSRDPSVDQLSALLGLTLILNKQGKHAAAVFSGQVPSTLEFLKPDETIEKNTDSLRDFIIALDKAKADKLRYKVEDNVVRIFITPYRTSISQEDFDFSQGDFNVDVVVALGVHQQEDLDEAITSHGRILHDATVTSINTSPDGGLGTINWHKPAASSLSELTTELAQALGPKLIDEQIATALLTGIVAETDRFRNDKTSADTMTMSAALMAAGANQQLVASKLEEPVVEPTDDDDSKEDSGSEQSDDESPKSGDGMLEINHKETDEDDIPQAEINDDPGAGPDAKINLELPRPYLTEEPAGDDSKDSAGLLGVPDASDSSDKPSGSSLITEPPTMGGTLTANSTPDEEYFNPLNAGPSGLPQAETPQLIDRPDERPVDQPSEAPAPPAMPEPQPVPAQPDPSFMPMPTPMPPVPQSVPAVPPPQATPEPPTPEPFPVPNPTPPPPAPNLSDQEIQTDTLAELEESVKTMTEPEHLDAARTEVNAAYNDPAAPVTPQPIQALNARPLGNNDLHPTPTPTPMPTPTPTPMPTPTPTPNPAAGPQVTDPTAPPPVPPPIPFQFGNQPPQQ